MNGWYLLALIVVIYFCFFAMIESAMEQSLDENYDMLAFFRVLFLNDKTCWHYKDCTSDGPKNTGETYTAEQQIEMSRKAVEIEDARRDARIDKTAQRKARKHKRMIDEATKSL